MQGKYLSEVVDMDDIHMEKINLIYAPCGSGKTTFAKTELLKYFLYDYDYLEYGQNVETESDLYWGAPLNEVAKHSKEKILYLIDTAIGKEQLLHSDGAKSEINIWTGQEEWELPGFKVMTYAGYAMLCKKAPEYNKWRSNAFIICDEFHNAVKWSKWKKEGEENLHEIAISEILYGVYMGYNKVFALSATPDILYKEMDNIIHEVNLLDEPRHFEENEVIGYKDLNHLLKKIPADKRGIIYITHISDIIKYQELLNKRGIKNGALWSLNNYDYPLSKEQKEMRKYIIENREMPPDIDVLFINKSCETSITIGEGEKTKNPIDYMIIHSKEEDTVIQARGRYRNDLNTLYYLEPSVYDKVDVPESWLNRPLNKNDKDDLCTFLGLKDNANGRLLKWTSIKKVLKANNYDVCDKRINGERCSFINLN